KNAMSAIQIVCAVAVPLLWGYQFVVIKVGVLEFPPLFFLSLRFLVAALLLIPFVKRPTRQQFGRIAAISVFLGGLNFGLFYVGLGLGSGSMSAIAYQLATPFTILLAWPLLAERPSLTTSTGVVIEFVGVVVFRISRLSCRRLCAGPDPVRSRPSCMETAPGRFLGFLDKCLSRWKMGGGSSTWLARVVVQDPILGKDRLCASCDDKNGPSS